MFSLNSLSAAIVIAGAASLLPSAAIAGGYDYYIATEDAPVWLPPAPYPFMDAPPMRYAPLYYLNGPGANQHVEWCEARYRSYNPETNMFLGYDGNYHPCRGPAS
jgi:hypothetical protein